MNYLSPSLLAADFGKLREELEKIEAAGAQYAHIDVMDGIFVPSISFGMPVIRSIRSTSNLVFDVHLMIEDPDRYIEDFAACGADYIVVHAEACKHLDRTIAHIHDCGKKAGVALNPASSLSLIEYVLPQVEMVLLMSVNPGFGGQKRIEYVTDKVRTLRKQIEEKKLNVDIEVDGGVTLDNVEELLTAGANVIVAGTAVFKGDVEQNVKDFLSRMQG